MPKPQKPPRWRRGRKPIFVQVQVWSAVTGGYVPMEMLYGYVTTAECQTLLRAAKALTTPLIPWNARPSRKLVEQIDRRLTEPEPFS